MTIKRGYWPGTPLGKRKREAVIDGTLYPVGSKTHLWQGDPAASPPTKWYSERVDGNDADWAQMWSWLLKDTRKVVLASSDYEYFWMTDLIRYEGYCPLEFECSGKFEVVKIGQRPSDG